MGTALKVGQKVKCVDGDDKKCLQTGDFYYVIAVTENGKLCDISKAPSGSPVSGDSPRASRWFANRFRPVGSHLDRKLLLCPSSKLA